MGYILLNLLPIAGATVAGLAVGAIYALLRGVRPSLPFISGIVVAEAWLAAILAGAVILAPPAGPGPWVMALASAVVIWVGFVGPAILVTVPFEGIRLRLAIADAAHWLVVMVAQAAVIQAIGTVRPPS